MIRKPKRGLTEIQAEMTNSLLASEALSASARDSVVGSGADEQSTETAPSTVHAEDPLTKIGALQHGNDTSSPLREARRGLPRRDVEPAPEPVSNMRADSASPVAAAAPLQLRKNSLPHPANTTGSALHPKADTKRFGRHTSQQGLKIGLAALSLLSAAALLVLLSRLLLSLDFMRDFLESYPGETLLPEGAPVGIPAWLGWQHFFNAFFILLIIRTGWQVRTQKRPAAMWERNNTGLIKTKNPPKKISLTLWAHLVFDALWLANGIIFVALLFFTGHWVRVVPTSWEIFPNAISAALQYASLDWPTDNGWVNYNSLQVLAYFVTIFIAAPLAAVTGMRLSPAWPSNAKQLNKFFPIEWARAIHFPVMLYFVLFIVMHVALVFATGALRNLNHMYAAQDAENWVGFWIFFASLVIMISAVVAARPLVFAPIAQLMGKVSR
jgi:thiosulfate reductase cytochrome b subunit